MYQSFQAIKLHNLLYLQKKTATSQMLKWGAIPNLDYCKSGNFHATLIFVLFEHF